MSDVDGNFHVEPVTADLVALARCHALDATVFPHPSLPIALGIIGSVSVLAARADGAVLGFVALRTEGRVADVTGVAVDAAHRGRGIGRAVVRAAIAWASARGCRAMTLHVSTGNTHAKALYESEGFRIAKRITRFYSPARFPDGGDAFAMIREL